MEKHELRELIKKRLPLITDKEKQSDAVCEKALALCVKTHAKAVAVYLSMPNEISTEKLISSLFSLGINVYAPKIIAENIVFLPINENSAYDIGAYGIREPSGFGSFLDFDIIFVPLVAFDSNNNRLGHGKGYYDRFLTACHGKKIGLAFREQQVPCVATENSDVPLDDVIIAD